MAKRINMYKDCEYCELPFKVTPSMLKRGRKCCSHACSKANLWRNPKYRKHMSEVHKGKHHVGTFKKGYKPSKEVRDKISIAGKGRKVWNKGLKNPQKIKEETRTKLSRNMKELRRKRKDWNVLRGKNHHNWKPPELRKKSEKKHLDGRYRDWMKAVKNRDSWKCKISDENCKGRLEAHHILRWSDFPKLRYEINNGITLCHAHHPRKRAEEKRLSPFFQELVSVSSGQFGR